MNAAWREESSALHALGLLAGEERARFREECHVDPTLREMSRALREVTSQLVHWAPPHSPPEALRERLVTGIDAHRRNPGGPAGRSADRRPNG
ncbi:MAG: hypothetical protein ACO3G4_15615 [Opitutaceae bacterium]